MKPYEMVVHVPVFYCSALGSGAMFAFEIASNMARGLVQAPCLPLKLHQSWRALGSGAMFASEITLNMARTHTSYRKLSQQDKANTKNRNFPEIEISRNNKKVGEFHPHACMIVWSTIRN